MEAIINYLDKYTTQIFLLQIGLLFILAAIITWVYFYNRKKYNHLKHQIPASVVKNYLDSIIQNSTALKSSLFRGGGLDVDASAIPSVMPLQNLERGANVDLDSKGDEALKAEIANLRSKVLEKQNVISDLEDKTTELNGVVKEKAIRIEELEKLLAEKPAGESTDSSELEAKLAEVSAERDELKDSLAQYAIVEDDLADLKKLRQENEQLKKSLADLGGSSTETDEIVSELTEKIESKSEDVVSAPVVNLEQGDLDQSVDEPEAIEEPQEVAQAEDTAPEEDSEPVSEPVAQEQMSAQAEGGDTDDDDEKSPEDLLSEFEKMLG